MCRPNLRGAEQRAEVEIESDTIQRQVEAGTRMPGADNGAVGQRDFTRENTAVDIRAVAVDAAAAFEHAENHAN